VRQKPYLLALKRLFEPSLKTRMVKYALGELTETTMEMTLEGSQAAYWINRVGTGVWRTARKQQICRAGHERHIIKPGDRYLDTGERTPDGVWATIKSCQECADAPLTF
jgi:hypothetical protein